jgi:hypothetical protein
MKMGRQGGILGRIIAARKAGPWRAAATPAASSRNDQKTRWPRSWSLGTCRSHFQ